MKPDLPDLLERYFGAQNAHDIDAMVACFAADAAVRDEGRDIIGADAIRSWKQETSTKYRITTEPLECHVETTGPSSSSKSRGRSMAVRRT